MVNYPWLEDVLKRNLYCKYLQKFGSPTTVNAYRNNVPLTTYDDLYSWMQLIVNGEKDVLFNGSPVAYERTGGSSSGPKLIPYTTDGLCDFQKNISQWIIRALEKYKISNKVYFATSPITRKPELINDIPVGLPDQAYIGDYAAILISKMSAVPLEIGCIDNVSQWKFETIKHLKQSADKLELVSVWSPTFFLELLEEINSQDIFRNLRVISCWTSGSSAPYAEKLKAIFPNAHIQAKGLMSTECVVTVLDEDENQVLAEYGFYEFKAGNKLLLENELLEGDIYEVVVTTASGLYRYCTGDYVLFSGRNGKGRAILEFKGRDNTSCDLVGEKLSEQFVAECLKDVDGFKMLIPDQVNQCYRLVVERSSTICIVDDIESRLNHNPQYEYARNIGQLKRLQINVVSDAKNRYVDCMLKKGVRLGDIKPIALRKEMDWVSIFGEL